VKYILPVDSPDMPQKTQRMASASSFAKKIPQTIAVNGLTAFYRYNFYQKNHFSKNKKYAD